MSADQTFRVPDRISRVNVMAPLRATVLVAAAALVASQCLEKYACIFHHDIGGSEYSWDLHQLCRAPGSEYFFNSSVTNQLLSFNICGNTSATCAPGYPMYNTHGNAVQFLYDPTTPTPACDPKAPSCTDYDYNVPTCCTGDCTVLVSALSYSLTSGEARQSRVRCAGSLIRVVTQGTGMFAFSLISEDPNGGVRFSYGASASSCVPLLLHPWSCACDEGAPPAHVPFSVAACAVQALRDVPLPRGPQHGPPAPAPLHAGDTLRPEHRLV
jgi:hypothetical protein